MTDDEIDQILDDLDRVGWDADQLKAYSARLKSIIRHQQWANLKRRVHIGWLRVQVGFLKVRQAAVEWAGL